MLLKDVRPGEVYAALNWGAVDRLKRDEDGNLAPDAWHQIGDRAVPVRVLEVRVPVSGYSRPGARVRKLNRDTMEPEPNPVEPERRQDGDGEFHDYGVLAVNLLGPWDLIAQRYHEWLEEREEDRVAREEEHRRERARRQEAAAKRWTEDVFAEARRDFEQVFAVAHPPQVLDGGAGAMAREPMDEELRALVELRYPDGNPYLNGDREAW